MRFLVKCDICNKEFKCDVMRLPKQIVLVEGLDMCDNCRFEYNKRLKKLIKQLQEEKFVLQSNKTSQEIIG